MFHRSFLPDLCLIPLCTRLLIEFNLAFPAARMLTELIVERHMRIMYVAPEHNEFIRSGEPSEPLLAEAAAKFMNECGFDDWAAFLAGLDEEDMAPGKTLPRGYC